MVGSQKQERLARRIGEACKRWMLDVQHWCNIQETGLSFRVSRWVDAVQDKSSRREGSDKSLSQRTSPPLRFAGLVLELDACTLARDSGEMIALTRGEFALLRMFVGRPGRVISRDALLDAFAEPAVSSSFDRSVDTLVVRLRRKIEVDPKQPRLIVTVPGEGYRFDGLRLRAPEIAQKADEDSALKREASLPRLSIVVLPFANIGRDPETGVFRGRRDREPHDRSVKNARRGRDRAQYGVCVQGAAEIDAKAMGRELNVRYMLEGSVQRAGARMRVNVQLIDAELGSHLWAERFDKPVANLFDMQDEIVARLAGALNTELVAAEARRAERSPTPELDGLPFPSDGLAQ